MFNVYYNGYYVEKKFSKEFLIHIVPELKNCVDWTGSTRKCLRVLDKRVYKQLLQCDKQYYWPDGLKFISRPYYKTLDNDTKKLKNQMRPRYRTNSPTKYCSNSPRPLKRVSSNLSFQKRSRYSPDSTTRYRCSRTPDFTTRSSATPLAMSPLLNDDWNEELKLYDSCNEKE
ncbi:lef-6 [Palpita vitrealis nucleopolyhedrovirus]|uniref:Lef-6 n=1 Tax=Palpita vitrealis nucleopolyhedrovirus TaxID=2951960 RepID=A0AAE9LNF8_9ABAC|nr:lef-6 [Palpita vitrealis nucleopolyhedrovirus]